MKRILFAFLAVVAVVGFAQPVDAKETLDSQEYMGSVKMERYGATVESSAGVFRVGIRPGIFEDAAWVKIKTVGETDTPVPEYMSVVSDAIYSYDVRVPNPTVTRETIWLSLDYDSDTNYRRRPYAWDRESQTWWEVPSRTVRGEDTFQFELPFPWSIVAVLEDTRTTDVPQKISGSVALPSTSFQAYAIMDGRTGEILESQNGDVQKYPASLTKLMTAMVMLDQDLDMQEVLTYTAEDEANGARLRISPGETLTREDAFMTTLVGSGNNTANLLARTSGMTYDEFIAAMNVKAAELGLTQTTFADPSGLSTENITTPEEYAVVVNESGKYYEIFQAFQVGSYYFETINAGVPHTIRATNKLSVSQRTIVSKTGYLDESLYNLGTLTEDAAGNQLIVVTFGNASSWARFTQTAQLIEWAFDAYSWN